MKIAYLVNQYPKISHTFIRREIRALEAMGVEVVRCAIRSTSEPLTDQDDRDEERRTRVLIDHPTEATLAMGELMARTPGAFAQASASATRLAARADTEAWRHAAYLAEACLFNRWCRRLEIEHVHVHFGTNSATVAWLSRLLGGPTFSMTVHGPEEFDRVRAIGLPEKLEAAAFTVAISEYGRSQLYRLLPVETWSRIHIVRCGLDSGFLDREPTPVPNASKLVFVGRLSEQKGVEILVDACGEVRRRRPDRSFEVVLIGDGERRAALEDRLRARDVADRVRIHGWTDAAGVRSALEASRALVAPSFAEGLPVVIMEALALGRPVLSTYVAGIPELVRPGETGWLVPAGAVPALADGIEAVLDADPAELSRLGAAGREAVRDRHDATANARSLLGHIRHAVAGSGHS